MKSKRKDLDAATLYYKQLFIKKGMTQKEIANRIGMYESDLSRVVQGYRKFPKKHLAAFCKALRIKQEELKTRVRVAA